MGERPSLSKGFFVHKAKGKISPKKKKTSDENQRRQKEFRHIWTQIDEKITNITANIHKDASSVVMNFVGNYQNVQTNPAVVLGAIPTIALMMGINIPDHFSFFSTLSSSLSDEGEFVASLQSGDCPNVPSLIQKLIQSVTQQQEDELNIKRTDCTFETLAVWYENKLKQKTSPRKKHKVKRPSVVIMLQDIEGFPPQVLQDFILICSHYLDRLPLILVLGVATAMVTVHRLLPLKVTSCLAIDVYTSPSASYVLNTILDEVLIRSDLPFRLGPKTFKFLTDTIIYHDFSVSNLSHILKFCVFEHFCTNPASALTYENVETQLKIIVNNLHSFQKFLEETSNEENEQRKRKQSHLGNVQNLLEGLYLYNKHLSVMLDFLYELACDLPGLPLGKQKRELYLLFLQQQIADSSEYKNAFKLFKLMSLDELGSRLLKALDVLRKYDVKDYIQDSHNVQAATKILDRLFILSEGPEEEDKEKMEKTKESKLTLNIQGKITRHTLQEHLLKAAKQRPQTKFELWRDDVVTNLDMLFRLLPPLVSVPLHEALYFDDLTTVKAHLNASPKMTIHTALVDPQRYLQCTCCVLKDEDEIPSTLPAISLAYKLMLEGSQHINIHDWLQSFISIRSQSRSQTPRKKRKNGEPVDDKMPLAEFFQALSELQTLGIVKPNKRKTDHVVRLTWGYC